MPPYGYRWRTRQNLTIKKERSEKPKEQEDFADLYPKDGQPAEAAWRLALVSVMQFVENLSDRQAANAVRGRLDWKYLLGLELDDPGFDHSVLAKIRTLNRIEGVGETFRATLNALAVAAPEWLTLHLHEEWVERYEHRVEDYRLPDGKQARQDYALLVGNGIDSPYDPEAHSAKKRDTSWVGYVRRVGADEIPA